jgi:UDP-glucose 4-epimerase
MTQQIAVVTGAAGFIGSHMVDLLLERGFKVHGIDNLSSGRESNLDHCRSNPNLVFSVQDIRDLRADDPLFNNAAFVFHFAGMGDIVPSIERPVDYMSTNIMGTVRVLEAARHAKVKKFIYAASSSCYGLATELPTKESTKIDPQYPYALSKYLGEQSVFHWGQVYHLPVISIRMFNVYGPRSRTSGAYGAVFGVFLAQKLAKKPLTIVGDGTQTRDFVFVTDVVKAYLMAAESDKEGEVYNLGAGKPESVNRLVELLDEKEISFVPKRPGEPDCTWADISKISAHLGWQPQISFEDGVAEMIKNIDYWRNAPVWDNASIGKATETWFQALSK